MRAARLERNGQVSVLQRGQPPRVLEVRVENGVQTVRIEIGSGGQASRRVAPADVFWPDRNL